MRLRLQTAQRQHQENDDRHVNDVHGEGMLGEEPAELFPAVEKAAEEREERQAHSHGEDRIPQREDGRLPAAIAYERALQADKRHREQYDRREYGQNEAQLPEGTGDRPEPVPAEGKYSDQEEAQVLGQVSRRREAEYRYTVGNDDPKQIAGRRQHQHEECNCAERETPGILRHRALRSVLHNRPPCQVTQVEYEQHHSEPHRPQGKQAGRCITCKRLLPMRANSRYRAEYEDVNERGDAEPQQSVLEKLPRPLALERPGREIPREQEEQAHEVCRVQHHEQIQRVVEFGQVLQHHEDHHPCAQIVGEVQAFSGLFCRKAYRPVSLKKSAG